jgi:hypothetical protein
MFELNIHKDKHQRAYQIATLAWGEGVIENACYIVAQASTSSYTALPKARLAFQSDTVSSVQSASCRHNRWL